MCQKIPTDYKGVNFCFLLKAPVFFESPNSFASHPFQAANSLRLFNDFASKGTLSVLKDHYQLQTIGISV